MAENPSCKLFLAFAPSSGLLYQDYPSQLLTPGTLPHHNFHHGQGLAHTELSNMPDIRAESTTVPANPKDDDPVPTNPHDLWALCRNPGNLPSGPKQWPNRHMLLK